MTAPRQRDTTTDSPDWGHLDEFYIGIGLGDRVRLTVYRNNTDHTLHRLVSDEMTSAGPCLIAAFTEPTSDHDDHDDWHPAWRTDPMRPNVEAQARTIARRR